MTITDPARELAEACRKLPPANNNSGEHVFAESFQVQAWSTDFFLLIFQMQKRCDELIEALELIEIDNDLRDQAAGHITQIKFGFGQDGLKNPWSHTAKNFINETNVTAVAYLSPTIRRKIHYPKLSDLDISALREDISIFKSWLEQHQFQSSDFIRELIIDSLGILDFRLKHLGWLGSGYSLSSLKEVLLAYMALERLDLPNNTDPVATAAKLKFESFIKNFYVKAKLVKDIAEVSGFVLKAIGMATSLIKGSSGVSGFLSDN